MGLQNVSETYQSETGPIDPKYPPAYALTPPVNLTDIHVFKQGYTVEAFAEMRKKAPIMWHPEPGRAGFWAATTYADVKAIELDPERFSSQRGGILMSYGLDSEPRHPLLHRASLDTLICLDPPYHMPLRMEHMAYFRPGYVAELRKKVDTKVAALLDDMAAKGPIVDMVETFSAELPLFTLCEILGVPEDDRPKLVHWMHYLETVSYKLQQDGMGALPQEELIDLLQNVQAMFDFGAALLQDRRKNPKQDLLSAIAHAKVDGELLSDEFLDGSWLLIVFAGNDTTRNSLSGTMKLLTENPDQKAKLLANPDLFPNFVHEAIRLVSPVTYMRRTATEDVEINGQKIAAGEKVLMYYPAVNRDPSVFAAPDTFDIERANAKDHLAFGFGTHVCLGQRVANMQLESAYRGILARYPNIKWTGDMEIAPNNFVHAISRLMVDLGG